MSRRSDVLLACLAVPLLMALLILGVALWGLGCHL